MSSLSGSSALWYLGRATGIVTLLLLTLTMLLGIGVTGRRTLPGLPKFVVLGLHRNASLLSIVFLSIHIASAVVDPYVQIRWLDAIVPFTSGYEPLALGLGAVAVDLLFAIAITTLLRRGLGRRMWRAVHLSAYAVWPMSLVHGISASPDLRSTPLAALAGLCAVAVAYAAAWRVLLSRPAGRVLRVSNTS